MSGKGHTFRRGGTHPPERKQLCDSSGYRVLSNPNLLTIATAQHLGAPAKPVVKGRDELAAGQLVAEAGGFVSANIHTPLAGTVRGLDMVHIGPVNSPAVTLKPADGAAPVPAYEANPPALDLAAFEPKEIIERIKDAGVVGMGGATFPTHVKLSPPPGVTLDALVINGAECEPYLTSDDCLMRNHPRQVIEGTRAVMKACGIQRTVIGIENNKPQAIRALRAAAEGLAGITVLECVTRYPQGSEKHLIETCVGRRVPPGKLPFSVGVVVQNVSTVAAIYEALQFNRPLTRRIVTVSGGAVANPQNVLAPVGTSVASLLEFCGGVKGELAEVVMGGPMMGRATSDITEPTTKGTSGVLFLSPGEVVLPEEEPCIRCGNCVAACPMGLVPTEIMGLASRERFDEAQDALDCIECGTCAYVCPSSRRLVHWIRLAKWELNRIRRRAQLKKEKAEAQAAK